MAGLFLFNSKKFISLLRSLPLVKLGTGFRLSIETLHNVSFMGQPELVEGWQEFTPPNKSCICVRLSPPCEAEGGD